MTNKEPSHGGPKGTRRSSLRTTRTLVATLVAGLAAPVIKAEEGGPDWAGIAKKAPEGLRKVAETKRSALFFIAHPIGQRVGGHLGFFISKDGLALCPLHPLCGKKAPKFHLGDEDRTGLKAPVVLAVFPKEELALLKFGQKPKSAGSLSISKEATPVGTWVAVLSAEIAPDPVLGPILSHRTTSIDSEMKSPEAPAKQFSFATGRGPRQEGVFFRGAPLLNLRGEVVAVFQGSVPLPIQTFRLATPTTGLPERIAEAVKKGGRLDIPLRAEHHRLDPAEFSDEYYALQSALMGREVAKGRLHAGALLKKFPDSFLAQKQEYLIASMGVRSGTVSPRELVELAKGLVSPGKAHPAAQAFYQNALGEALLGAGQVEEAIAAFKRSDELNPAMLAGGSLAHIFHKKNQLKEAEHYYRRAANSTPERIAFWDKLQGILSARGKSKESSEIFDRVLLLENFYSSR